ncbi:flagellar protein FlaG [Pseudoduganella namucuonensis]|uniref:Flagellar protein FlaG n=1 Tax=Pseudoduganella namucuonensis TaxID=1035707 RepID=A0A1I7KZI6_9BURK|nr:flagellar protein FlaG [Pseudoduganella namucuonensis]SFV02861.1 flagellar protein FlaG [Pseudoduganella namucuonensis]
MTIDSISAAGPSRPAERAAAAVDAVATHATGQAPATALATANAVKAPAPAPTLEQVNQAVSELNKASQAKSQGLEFSVDNDSKRTIVKVVDQTTKEVLRQIPSPEALEIAKSLDNAKGLLIRQTA